MGRCAPCTSILSKGSSHVRAVCPLLDSLACVSTHVIAELAKPETSEHCDHFRGIFMKTANSKKKEDIFSRGRKGGSASSCHHVIIVQKGGRAVNFNSPAVHVPMTDRSSKQSIRKCGKMPPSLSSIFECLLT